MKTPPTLMLYLSTVLTASAFRSTSTYARPLSEVFVDREGRKSHIRYSPVMRLAAKSKGNSKSRSGPEMDDAFRQLEQLSFLSEKVPASPFLGEDEQEQKMKRDVAFAKAMKELNLKEIIDIPPASAESEADLYNDMAKELSSASSEDELVADLKIDLDLDFGVTPMIGKNEALINKAIDEALKEANEQSEDIMQKESLLDNKEIMAEIEKIFDRANDQLLQGLEEIRSEQMSLARQSAERNAKVSQAKIEEDGQRLAFAEANMKKMLTKVNEETRNVEEAIADLKRAQEESEGGLNGQLSSLKSGGLVKQSALAGSILFTVRAGVDVVGYLGGDPSFAFPALFQGVLAIICIVGFIFL